MNQRESTVTAVGDALTHPGSLPADSTDRERRLYDAECQLHAAHQTGVDAWISAASDRLHRAVVDLFGPEASGGGAGSVSPTFSRRHDVHIANRWVRA